MKNQNNNSEKWMTDFSEFMHSHENVPDHVNAQLDQYISKKMHPALILVFSKIAIIHTLVGYLSLAICNQFDLNPFNTQFSLSNVFMNFGGHSFCMIACGILFISLSIALSGFILNIEELRTLKKSEFLQITFLSLSSLGLFILLGAEVSFTFGSLWLLGALIGGLATTESLFLLRQKYN